LLDVHGQGKQKCRAQAHEYAKDQLRVHGKNYCRQARLKHARLKHAGLPCSDPLLYCTDGKQAISSQLMYMSLGLLQLDLCRTQEDAAPVNVAAGGTTYYTLDDLTHESWANFGVNLSEKRTIISLEKRTCP
jgi:hypothetical protein